MSFEKRLKELGIDIPELQTPIGSYLSCIRSGNLIYLSGILPLRNGKLIRTGRVGESVSFEEARDDARITVINALSVLKTNLGSLDRVKKCIKITGYIASASGFFDQPKVLNAASDFLFEIFGEAGRHARTAVGVNALPLNAPLEIEFIFEIS